MTAPAVVEAALRSGDEIGGGRERLGQLVSDGHGHVAHRVVAGQVIEVLRVPFVLLLGADVFGDVVEEQQVAAQIVLDTDVLAAPRMPPALLG